MERIVSLLSTSQMMNTSCLTNKIRLFTRFVTLTLSSALTNGDVGDFLNNPNLQARLGVENLDV